MNEMSDYPIEDGAFHVDDPRFALPGTYDFRGCTLKGTPSIPYLELVCPDGSEILVALVLRDGTLPTTQLLAAAKWARTNIAPGFDSIKIGIRPRHSGGVIVEAHIRQDTLAIWSSVNRENEMRNPPPEPAEA